MHCVKCRKNAEGKNPSKLKLIILSKIGVCGTNKLRFIKEQRATVLLSSLGIKTPVNKVLLIGPLLL